MASLYLSAQQLCDRWHIKRRTLARWREQQYGPAYIKVGNRILYPVSTIESYERVHLHLSTSELVHQQPQKTMGGYH